MVAETTTVPPSAANHTEGAETKESTTSALDSLAETAESVIQETTKKATIIRVEDKTEAATKAPEAEASTTAAPTTKEETVRETTAPSTEGTEETSVKIIRVGSNEEADHEYSGYAVRAAAEEQNAETFLLEPETAAGSEAGNETGGLEQAAEVEESAANGYSVHTAAASHALICPGHIDLKITVSMTQETLWERRSPYPRTEPAGKAGTAE